MEGKTRRLLTDPIISFHRITIHFFTVNLKWKSFPSSLRIIKWLNYGVKLIKNEKKREISRFHKSGVNFKTSRFHIQSELLILYFKALRRFEKLILTRDEIWLLKLKFYESISSFRPDFFFKPLNINWNNQIITLKRIKRHEPRILIINQESFSDKYLFLWGILLLFLGLVWQWPNPWKWKKK